jgi:GxxExxY protein
MELLFANTTNLILKAFYGFKNDLPIELDLSFFKNALEIEMQELGLKTEKDKYIEILHKQKVIGKLSTDFLVNNEIILKIVSTKINVLESDKTEMKTFLRLTLFEVGMILNFGSDGQHERILLTNDYKGRHKLNTNQRN